MKFKTIKSTMVASVLMVLISSPANSARPMFRMIAEEFLHAYNRDIHPERLQEGHHDGPPFWFVFQGALDKGLLLQNNGIEMLKVIARYLLHAYNRDFHPGRLQGSHFDGPHFMQMLEWGVNAGVFPPNFMQDPDATSTVIRRFVSAIKVKIFPSNFEGTFKDAIAILNALEELDDTLAAPSPIRMPFQPPVAAPPPPVRRVVDDTRLLTIEDLEMEFGLDLSSPPTESYMKSPATPESRGEQPAVVSDEMQGQFFDLLIQWQDATTAKN